MAQPLRSLDSGNVKTNNLGLDAISQRLTSVESLFAKKRTEIETTQMLEELSSLYVDVSKQNLPVDERNNVISRICYIFGRERYGKSMEESRQLLQLSLALQLNPLKYPIPAASDLKSLPAELSKLFPDFGNTIELLKDADHLAIKDTGKAFTLASTLRWLGHSYQNLKNFNTKENLQNFERIYGLAKQTLEPIRTADSEWEICELLYNTDRFLITLRAALSGQPKDAEIQDKLDSLKKIDAYIENEHGSARALQKLAQVSNIMMMGYEQLITNENRKEIRQKQWDLIANASTLIASNPQSDPFLKTMFKNNKAALGLKALNDRVELANIEELKKLSDLVLAEIKELDYSHIYHAGYIINAAKLAQFQQDKPRALELLDLAEKVANKHKDSCDDEFESIAKLRAELK